MTELREKYINPFTDYGFKKLFGEEINKDLLRDFLNELLKEEQGEIVNLTYLKSEHLGTTEIDRRAIFDLYCENEKGQKFIVELQKSKQNFFKDRSLYYATFPIRDQAQRADWNFELQAVYTIAILDFVFEEGKNEPKKYRYDVKLKDIETNKIFYDKLTFIYLEMPKFNKKIEELETRFDKWLYVIKNLNRLDRIPDKLREKIFDRVFEAAEIARFTPEQARSYETSLKYYRDLKNSFDTAHDDGMVKGIKKGRKEGLEKGRKQGLEKGRKEEKIKIAKNLLEIGVAVELIAQSTKLSIEEINKLK
jgi:predicted transposase/invertase (TIGR01784 family)